MYVHSQTDTLSSSECYDQSNLDKIVKTLATGKQCPSCREWCHIPELNYTATPRNDNPWIGNWSKLVMAAFDSDGFHEKGKGSDPLSLNKSVPSVKFSLASNFHSCPAPVTK